MTAPVTTDRPAVYAVIDLTHSGRPRVVAEYRDPGDAQRAADLLRWAGADARVELVAREEQSS